jgi:predicted acylesterase/phospholipase RssA
MPAASAPSSAADGAAGAAGAPPLALPGAVEAALLRQRRLCAGVAEDAPTVGLALSGGGVRSATFGLGLLRGLAQRGQLLRIDYLSTVSGGGYIGAMFGRLAALVGIAAAERLLAANDRNGTRI